jgi:hypothetical protein
MASNAEFIKDFNKKYGEYLIDKEGDYICNRCKKVWEPDNTDINRKALMSYYRCCKSCRLYLYNREIARKERERKLNICYY